MFFMVFLHLRLYTHDKGGYDKIESSAVGIILPVEHNHKI